MATRVVHCKKEPYDVYIGRPSKWGNPFTHIKDRKTRAEFIVESREEAVSKYRQWIMNQPELLKSLPELKDKTLGCWCIKNSKNPPFPYVCHGQVLVELIDKL
jgi:hypothetical protein